VEWWEFFLVMLVVMPIVVLWLGCIIDAIGRPDLRGLTKAMWVLFILFFPLIGSLVYIIARPAIVAATRPAAVDAYDIEPDRQAAAETLSDQPQSFGF
jgi:hypothetical protein